VLGPLTAITVNEGMTANATLSATDEDGDTLTFSLSVPPAFVNLVGTALTATPGFSDSGTYPINVNVSDGTLTTSGVLTITVVNVNRSPTLAVINDLTMTAGTTSNVNLVGADPDGDVVSYGATNLPAFAQLTGTTLTFTPSVSIVDTRTISVTATDGTLTVTQSFNLTVNAPPNQPPVLTNLAQVDASGVAIATGATVVLTPRFRGTVSDPESSQVKLEVETALTSASFTNTATASGTLAAAGTLDLATGSLPAGIYKWQLRAVDAQGAASAWQSFNAGNAAFTIQAGAISGSLTIAAGASATLSSTVALSITATPSAGGSMSQMRFSNDGVTFSAFEAYATTRSGWALSGGDGTKTVTVEVRDSNSITAQFSDTIALDTVAPTISAFAVNASAVATTNAAVSLTYAATDPAPGTGIVLVEASNDGSTFSPIAASPAAWSVGAGADGTRTVTVRVTDGAGNQATLQDSIILDTTAPTINTTTLNSGALYTNSTTATLVVAATDGLGSGNAEICVSGAAVAGCQAYGTGTVTITLTNGDALKNVLVTVKDQAGNASLPGLVSITLDTVPPTLSTVTLNLGALLTNNPLVSVLTSAADNGGGSGLGGIAFQTQPSAYEAYGAYASPTSYTMTGADGLKTIGVKVRDNAGNESATVIATIVLDTAPPSGTVSINSNATYTNVTGTTLGFSTSDATSVVTHYCANETNTPPASAADGCWLTLATNAFTLQSGQGTHTVYVFFKDLAGNYTTTAATNTIILDTVLPALSVAGGGLGIAGGATFTNILNPAFNNTASDATSGLATVCTGVSSPPLNCVAYSSTPVLTLAGPDGAKTAYISVTDNAGNVSLIASDGITLDQTAPTVSNVQINANVAFTNSVNVTVTSTASDATSGVVQMQFSDDNVTWKPAVAYSASAAYTVPNGDGLKTVYVRVIDGAGNTSTGLAPSDSITLDTTPPSATLTAAAGRYTNTSPTNVNISPVEAGSGVSKMCVKLTPVAAVATPPAGSGDVCFVVFATPTSVAINTGGDGDKRVWVWLLDNAGNISGSAATVDIWYDATVPVAPNAPTLSAAHRSIAVNWTGGSDGSSGVVGYQVGTSLTSGSGYVFGETVAGSPQTLVKPNGVQQYIVVRTVDRAGNLSVASAQASAAPRYPFNHYQRTPSSSNFNAVSYLSGSRYLAVGQDGMMFSSDDTFTTPTRRDPMTDGHLRGVSTAPIGFTTVTFVVGDDGFISSSTDNAVSFTQETNTQPGTKANLYDVTFAGAPALFDNYYVAVGASGTVLRGSALGPRQFEPVASPVGTTLRSVARCASASGACVNGNITVAVGDSNAMIRSTDYGATWATVTLPVGYAASTAWTAVVGMPSSNVMYASCSNPAAGRSGLITSSDGGATWAEVAAYINARLTALSAPASGAVLWVGGYTTFAGFTFPYLASFTGGVSTAQSAPGTLLLPITSIAARTTTELVAVDGTDIERTTAPPTWTSASTGAINEFRDITDPSGLPGAFWMVGPGGYVTYNGGWGYGAWAQQATGLTTDSLFRVAAVSTGSLAGTTVFAVGGRTTNTILKTTNGGANWVLDADSGITANVLYGVACRNTTTCISVGANQTVLTWSGGNWVVNATGAGSSIYYGVDTYFGGGIAKAIVVGSAGVLRTLDGATWTNRAPINAAVDFKSVQAKKNFGGIAIAVGTGGAIYKSTDHGVSWTVKPSNTIASLNDIEHAPGTTVWYASGANGLLIKSTDDGETWGATPLVTSTSQTLYGLASNSAVWPGDIYASGTNGAMIYSATYGY
jgi:photosystem II stability/assembly factor-like uncharacterized protein